MLVNLGRPASSMFTGLFHSGEGNTNLCIIATLGRLHTIVELKRCPLQVLSPVSSVTIVPIVIVVRHNFLSVVGMAKRPGFVHWCFYSAVKLYDVPYLWSSLINTSGVFRTSIDLAAICMRSSSILADRSTVRP